MAADLNSWNEQIIAEFRANAGYVAWSSEAELAAGRPIPPRPPCSHECSGVPIILLHHIGTRTGRERINPMLSQPLDDGFAVFATYGGSPRHPAWYRNLVGHPRAEVEAGAERFSVMARTAQGSERERIWTRQIARMPAFGEFETTAGRQIPVVVLERVVLELADDNPVTLRPDGGHDDGFAAWTQAH